MHARTKQLTQLANIKMTMDRLPGTYLKVVHAQIAFADLKTAFNRPARKGYPQQPFQPDIPLDQHQVRQKIFHLVGIQHIAGDHQRMSRTGQTMLALFAIKKSILDFPNHRTFFSLLDAKTYVPQGGEFPEAYTGILKDENVRWLS